MKCFVVSFLSLFVSVVSFASTLEAGSKLEFEAIQNGAAVSGEFKKFDVQALFNDDIEKMQFTTVVDITSLYATYEEVQTNLQSAEWLDAPSFATAKYQSSKITQNSDGTFSILGELLLKGITQPISGKFTVVENAESRFVADFEFNLNRLDYNVGWQDTNVVKNEVKITSHLILKK